MGCSACSPLWIKAAGRKRRCETARIDAISMEYGQFLGNRYKDSPNIIWNLGNDFQNWATATNDSVILAIADGIKSVDTNHLMTIELNYLVSESLDD
jgi:hypothetical protein